MHFYSIDIECILLLWPFSHHNQLRVVIAVICIRQAKRRDRIRNIREVYEIFSET